MPRITPGEYQMIQTELITMAATVQGFDLEGFLENISYADTMGPILDPTLWTKGSDRMHKIEQIARAALRFQKECAKALGVEEI
jgi:hypothetical protein